MIVTKLVSVLFFAYTCSATVTSQGVQHNVNPTTNSPPPPLPPRNHIPNPPSQGPQPPNQGSQLQHQGSQPQHQGSQLPDQQGVMPPWCQSCVPGQSKPTDTTGADKGKPNFERCDTITVAQLNNHPKSCANILLTPECMAKFDVKELGTECLENIPGKTISNLKSDTWEQLSNGPLENLPKNTKFLNSFLNRNNFKTNPAVGVLKAYATDKKLMAKVLEEKVLPVELLARLITADTLPLLKKSSCAKITPDIVAELSKDVFSNIEPGCLRNIPPKTFASMSNKQIGYINPDALSGLTAPQADKIPRGAAGYITEDQAKNWGVKIHTLDNDASEEQRKEEERDLRSMKEEHPCNVTRKWLSNTSWGVRKALKRRCKVFWNSASTTAPPNVISLLLLITAALVFSL